MMQYIIWGIILLTPVGIILLSLIIRRMTKKRVTKALEEAGERVRVIETSGDFNTRIKDLRKELKNVETSLKKRHETIENFKLRESNGG